MRSVLCLALVLGGAATLRAQVQPERRLFVGIVRDTAGSPLPGVEVSIPGLHRRAFTGSDGAFRFDTVPAGVHEVRARKIGFTAQVQRFLVDSGSPRPEFHLVPTVQALPAMVTAANRRGLSGHVDERGKGPLPGAVVHVLGTPREATTDANGDFQLTLQRGGSYMVSFTKDSFSIRLVSVRIPDDSGRNIVTQMDRATKALAKDQAWILPDLRERQDWILPQDRVLYSHEDLERLKIEWIYDAVDMAGPKLRAREHYNHDCSVVVDGGPKTANLSTLTIDDVESVEIYRGFSPVPPSVRAAAPRGKTSKWKKSQPPMFSGPWLPAAKDNFYAERYCPAVYVWMR